MPDATSISTASSTASGIEDIMRLIAPGDREGFREMLQHELRSFHELPDSELRRVAVDFWHRFTKHGWPRRD
jgi:hypothetical protein